MAAPETPRRRPSARLLLPVTALVLVLLVGLLPAPYVIEEPGPVFNTLGTSRIGGRQVPLIAVPGRRTYPTSGRLDLLTVSLVGSPGDAPSWLDLARAWFDPYRSVIPIEAVYPPGVSEKSADAESAAEMTDSQQSATAAALTRLGYTVAGAVRVDAVEAGSAATGVLHDGDTVTRFAGHEVHDRCSLQNAVAANGTAAAPLVITRNGVTTTVRVTPRRTAGSDRPLIGIQTSASYRFPFRVQLRIADVGGPSAGQMFALGIIDRLTPGALTGGRHVAGTGTICGDGTVGAIGGIVEKMAAARAAGATVFLAPRSNCDEVRGHIPGGLSVYAVRTLGDSMAVLKAVRTGAFPARLPRCPAG